MSTKEEKPLFKEIPKDYSCTDSGVFAWKEDKDGNKEKDWIAFSPVGVVAISRDESSGNWGIVVRWLDLDDQVHEQAIPKKLLHTYGTELAQRLVDSGLDLIPGKEKALLIYLSRFRPKDRVVAASSTGWLGESFVLPERTLLQPEGEVIVYQPTGISNVARAVCSKGSLEGWREGMVGATPVVIFMVCAALSAPIRFKVGVEGGGFHFYGLTSVGKTTAGQAAASTSGNGVDPAIAGGAEAYVQRWNSTTNALEAKAETFNDLAMVIDEIGEGDGKAFGATIYRLISGTGRGRANREGNLRDSKTWRALILSTGELAVSQHIEQGGGSMKGGQLVRMVDIDLSKLPALFPDGNAANAMKQLCATHYGHAVPALIESVDDLTVGWRDFPHEKVGDAVSRVSQRVRTRFALVAHAGILANRAGIVPWSEAEVLNSVQTVFSAWKGQASIVSDVERGVSAIRDFILENDARFERENSPQIPSPRYGWFRDRAYHFTTAAFKKACNGADPQIVKHALDQQGILHRPNSKSMNSRIRVNGERVIVVSVLTTLLDLVGTSVDGMDSMDNQGEKPPMSTPSIAVHTKYDKPDSDVPGDFIMAMVGSTLEEL